MGQVCVVPATVSAVRVASIPVRSASGVRNRGVFCDKRYTTFNEVKKTRVRLADSKNTARM